MTRRSPLPPGVPKPPSILPLVVALVVVLALIGGALATRGMNWNAVVEGVLTSPPPDVAAPEAAPAADKPVDPVVSGEAAAREELAPPAMPDERRASAVTPEVSVPPATAPVDPVATEDAAALRERFLVAHDAAVPAGAFGSAASAALSISAMDGHWREVLRYYNDVLLRSVSAADLARFGCEGKSDHIRRQFSLLREDPAFRVVVDEYCVQPRPLVGGGLAESYTHLSRVRAAEYVARVHADLMPLRPEAAIFAPGTTFLREFRRVGGMVAAGELTASDAGALLLLRAEHDAETVPVLRQQAALDAGDDPIDSDLVRWMVDR